MMQQICMSLLLKNIQAKVMLCGDCTCYFTIRFPNHHQKQSQASERQKPATTSLAK
jgi:hypothetical protein